MSDGVPPLGSLQESHIQQSNQAAEWSFRCVEETTGLRLHDFAWWRLKNKWGSRERKLTCGEEEDAHSLADSAELHR